MATRKTKFHGGSTKNVARNVRRIREAQGLSAAKLSDRTAELGYGIPREGIQKIEAAAEGRPGARHINADELMVLALALNTSPVALLLGTPDHAFAGVEITGAGEVGAKDAWYWATGDSPLPPRDGYAYETGELRRRNALFMAYARPWFVPEHKYDDELRLAVQHKHRTDRETPPDGQD